MLVHAAETERRYVNENVEQIAKTFDPIRIRLRVIPTGRVPNTQGKTADYYFKEAAKKSVAGELTYGIELLKKGLLINPNHMQCRFNHGVLMFKFGLVREALEDFETIVRNHPRKELWAYYNRAICLIQLEEVVFDKKEMKAGKILFEPRWEDEKMQPKPFLNTSKTRVADCYHRANEDCDTIIKCCSQMLSDNDKAIDYELYIDALKLKGIINYRLGLASEAVKYFNFSKRMLENFKKQAVKKFKQNVENEYYDAVIKLNRDYFKSDEHQEDVKKVMGRRKGSFEFKRHETIEPELERRMS
jgi:tetratricopeptide (TPR) repeat protein